VKEALASNADSEQAKKTVTQILSKASVSVEPRAQTVVLRYVRPEERDKWTNSVIKYDKGTVTLRATDAITDDAMHPRLDAVAVELQYQILLIGRPDLDTQSVWEIGQKVAKAQVLDVKEIQPKGDTAYATHLWKITYDGFGCPEKLQSVRRIILSKDGTASTVDVHHPRRAHRFPCARCLSVAHPVSKCETTKVAEAVDRHT
jgi:hypothetical protein